MGTTKTFGGEGMSGNIIDHCISNAEYAEIQVALKNYIKHIREDDVCVEGYVDALSKNLSQTLSKIKFFVRERNV